MQRLLLALVPWGLIPTMALGASYDAQIDTIAQTSFELSQRAEQLEAEARPGSHITAEEAAARFDQTLVKHLVGDHRAAAEGFFTLVSTGVLEDSGLHRDAEWYLGEALLALENYRSAAQRFRAVVDDETHPFRDDGVRRLLEIYARAHDRAAFEALYEEQIAGRSVAPSPLVTYTLAKGYYQQGLLDRATEHFAQVPADSEFGARARYFVGVIAVVEGDLPRAARVFEAVADMPWEGAEGRHVHDLALLALGRIHYDHQNYDAAAGFYDRVEADSTFQAEKLYELVWSSIRAEHWDEALNHVEVFLLAFPDHRYTAQMTLLQGHLNVQQEQWDGALLAYGDVVGQYGPLRDRFAQLARPRSDARPEIREVMEDLGGVSDLPPFAVAMLRADPRLARAIEVFRDLHQERAQLEAAEALIAELRVFMEQQGSMGPYAPLRLEALERRGDVVRQRIELLRTQARWVADAMGAMPPDLEALESKRQALEERFAASSEADVDRARASLLDFERRVGALRAEANTLRARGRGDAAAADDLRARLDLTRGLEGAERRGLEADLARRLSVLEQTNVRLSEIEHELTQLEVPDVLAQVDPGASDSLFADLGTLARQYAGIRSQVGPLSERSEQIDAANTLLDDAYARLGSVVDAVADAEDDEIRRLRTQFDALVAQVADLRTEHDRTTADAQQVSDTLTRHGFATLEAYFAGSVERADVGIVDVHWAQKLGVADELAMLRSERGAVLDRLDTRFQLIRKRMGREP